MPAGKAQPVLGVNAKTKGAEVKVPASDGCGRHFDQHYQGLFKTLIERLQGDSLNRQSDLV